jgi:hypothetical protein
MTRQEKIAAALLAAEEVKPAEAGERAIMAWRNAEHSGDCTKSPWACVRCRYDDYMHLATRLEVRLETFGLSIAG